MVVPAVNEMFENVVFYVAGSISFTAHIIGNKRVKLLRPMCC